MADEFESDFLKDIFKDDELKNPVTNDKPQMVKHSKPANTNIQTGNSDFVDVNVQPQKRPPQRREVDSVGSPVKGLQQGQRVQTGQVRGNRQQVQNRPMVGSGQPLVGSGQPRPQQNRNIAPRSVNGVQRQSAKPSDPVPNRQHIQNPYANEQVQVKKQKKPKKVLTKEQKKKRAIIGIIIVVILLAVVGVVAVVKNKEVPIKTEYDETGRRAVDEYLQYVKDYDTDKFVDSSYLAQEKDYANGSEIKIQFIQNVCKTLEVSYPTMEQLSNKGRVYKDKKTGETNEVESDLTEGEEVNLTIIDYKALSDQMNTNSTDISVLFQSKGYTTKDLNLDKEMQELFCEYINGLQDIPTTTVKWKPVLDNVGQTKGTKKEPVKAPYYVVTEDESLDKLLFGSDDFHNCLDTFGKAATSWTPTVTVTQQQEVENPEYTDYMAQYNALVQAYTDRGKKYPGKEGQLYKYNKKKMKLKKNKKGKYTKIKKPVATILQDVTVEVDNPYNSDIVLPWTFLGAEFCQKRYKGTARVLPEDGTGTFDRPAGIGTPVITKALGSDGNYYDVKITLTGMWAGQSAIDYATKFSEKNRGFLSNNSVQLVIFELSVQNLSGVDFHIADDLILSDRNANAMSKTGIIYGLSEELDIHAGETITLQDFQTSQVLSDKYLIWGKSFNRMFEPVWFKVLTNDIDGLNTQLGVTDNSSDTNDEDSSSSEESEESVTGD